MSIVPRAAPDQNAMGVADTNAKGTAVATLQLALMGHYTEGILA